MPQRLQMIGIILESLLLTILNTFIFITWFSLISVIPIILSSLWSIGRIKRDMDKYNDGSFFKYIKATFTRLKKN